MVQCHWSPLKLDLDPIFLSRESLFQGTISLAKHRRNNINPLSPNSDQHQFSPNNIHMLPRGMVMRVNKMITKEKML